MVQELVQERKQLQESVVREISQKWAEQQTIAGPVLVVPYKTIQTSSDGKTTIHRNKAYILPEKLKINGNVISELKKRSIYHVSLYRSDMKLSGTFSPDAIEKLKIRDEQILWDECRLVLGISDARGLEEEVALQWDSNKKTMEPGMNGSELFDTELGSLIPFDTNRNSSFQIALKVKGSTSLDFLPLGKSTEVNISSNWQDPSYDGYYLPNSSDNKNGFSAMWKVLQVSRSFPQYWTNQNIKASTLYQSEFGVKLIQPADHYAKTDRSVKYAILIIGLTFTVFFFVEVMQKVKIHPLQYILVGIALIVFYTLLLSISEYTGFNIAYLVAAAATVTLIGSYVWSVVKKGKVAIGFTAALSALYTYLFMLIQLKEYALISGSIGLFVVLAIIMYFSRKIDWYNEQKTEHHA